LDCYIENDNGDICEEDLDPMDDHGHGTHCAGIASGNGVLKGVAPDSKLYAYKVLSSSGSGRTDNIIKAIEKAVDPNGDGDFSDHIDIISLSLGVRCTFTEGYSCIGEGCDDIYTELCGPEDPQSQAIDNAVSEGVVAVIAAGNSGPGGGISSPGTSKKAITVGATYNEDNIGTNAKLIINLKEYKALPLSIITSNEEITGEVVHTNIKENKSLTGKIALVLKNHNSSDEIISNVENRGGIGVIIYQKFIWVKPKYGYNDYTIIPAVSVTEFIGKYLINLINENNTEAKIIVTHNTENVAPFSSNGFVLNRFYYNEIFKPDILAPGVSICSLQYDDYHDIRGCLDEDHTSIMGTSMATPHVAGAVALLKQRNPDWTPDEIKRAFKNTAYKRANRTIQDIYVYGPGRIDVEKALKLSNKPLIAEIETNGTINLSEKEFKIIGTVKGEEFINYSLYYTDFYRALENPIKICSSNLLVEKGVICTWNLNQSRKEKSYILKLVVNGNNEESVDTSIININLLSNYCGNGIREEGEECGKDDDINCPEICLNDCICQSPNPQSKIVNHGSFNVSGNLTIKIKEFFEYPTYWDYLYAVINKSVIIPANGLLKLDAFFNDKGINISKKGIYGVFAEFVDSDGEKIDNEFIFYVN